MNRKSINRGKQLKTAREYRGYSQKELVSNIKGLSQPNLSRFEHGFDNIITEDKLKNIMEFLNWPYTWLDVRHPQYYSLQR